MGLILSSFAMLVQCAISVAYAGSGHTIRNGGDTAEITFQELFRDLPKAMRPCLTNANLCNLSPAEKSALLWTLTNQAKCHDSVAFDSDLKKPFVANCGEPLIVNPAELYAADGKQKSTAEFMTLALTAMQTCAGTLSVSLAEVPPKALEFGSFHSTNVGNDSVHVFTKAGSLGIETSKGVQSFDSIVRRKLRLDDSVPVGFRVNRASGGRLLEINGQISYVSKFGAQTLRHFSLIVDGTKVELQVF